MLTPKFTKTKINNYEDYKSLLKIYKRQMKSMTKMSGLSYTDDEKEKWRDYLYKCICNEYFKSFSDSRKGEIREDRYFFIAFGNVDLDFGVYLKKYIN